MTFNNWLDTFISEKEIDLHHTFEVEGPQFGMNYIPVGVVIEHIKIAPRHEQSKIKNVIVKIDFANGNVLDFFKHLAGALAI